MALRSGGWAVGDGSGGRLPWRLLQLRGARTRVPRWANRRQGLGADEDAGTPLAQSLLAPKGRPTAGESGGPGGGFG